LTKLEPNEEYEVQLMGLSHNAAGDLTADDEEWISEEPEILNVFVTIRKGDEIDEVLDIDVPASMPQLAHAIHDVIEDHIRVAERQGVHLF